MPPDGKFSLFTYRVRGIGGLPLYVNPNISFAPAATDGSGSEGRLSVMVGAKHSDGKPIDEVSVRIPLPAHTANASFSATVSAPNLHALHRLHPNALHRGGSAFQPPVPSSPRHRLRSLVQSFAPSGPRRRLAHTMLLITRPLYSTEHSTHYSLITCYFTRPSRWAPSSTTTRVRSACGTLDEFPRMASRPLSTAPSPSSRERRASLNPALPPRPSRSSGTPDA